MAPSTLFAMRRPLRPDPDETVRLWAYYAHSRDGAAREKLLEAYMEFARMMAAKVFARRSYTEMEFADYLQYATVGLIEAIDRFEPQRGIKFETYAASRISGAMLTGIECSSEIQRQISTRKRVLGQRVASLMDAPGSGGGADSVFSRLAEIAIGLAVGFALENTGMHSGENAEYPDNSYTGVELKQLQARMGQALLTLPDKQRHVIEQHYLQHLAFDEIAAALSLSRGRIAQIHKQALASLRTLLQNAGEMDLHF
jgi:RNA polymerase sigma factor for flagellar operon FliA